MYLLNAHRQGIYAAVNGQGVAPQAVLPLLPLAAPLIAAASRLPQNALLAARENSAHLTPALQLVPRGLVAFARVAGQPVVLAVSPVRAPAGATGPVFYLLSVVPLDDTFINTLSHRHWLNPLRFSATPQSRRETALTLIDPQGQPVSAIRWRPQHPGAEVLRATWPVILPIAVLLLAVIAWMMRTIWQSALRLRQTVIAPQASEAQALHVAYHDVLTGLPNRAMLDDCLAQALAYPARQSDCTALLALDLDRFKQVNDSLGHHGGDALIKAVAARLCTLVSEGCLVARTGGDEFLILQRDVKARQDVRALGLLIIDAVKQPFQLGGHDIFIGVSIGVALAPTDAIEKEDLKRKADIALYAAKARGRDGFQWFEQSLDESLRARSPCHAAPARGIVAAFPATGGYHRGADCRLRGAITLAAPAAPLFVIIAVAVDGRRKRLKHRSEGVDANPVLPYCPAMARPIYRGEHHAGTFLQPGFRRARLSDSPGAALRPVAHRIGR